MMPGMSGFDVCDRLKEYHEAKDIPIIIFTAKEITAEDKGKARNRHKEDNQEGFLFQGRPSLGDKAP